MAGVLLQRLRDHCDRERLTVIWHCDGTVLCTTGQLKQVGDDFLAVQAHTPTVREECGGCECEDFAAVEALVIIAAESVCGLVLGVPKCRQAALPVCCACHQKR